MIDRLAADLRREFPDMTGLSRTNLKYMRSLAEAYPGNEIGQQAVGQIPWGHNIVLLTRLDDPAERLWYAARTVEHGWSRAVLVHQIESGLHARQGQAVTNFERTLPHPQSDLARDLLKDPYNFGFLGFGPEVHERELERALVAHVRDFLLELGVGFAFVNSQYRLEVEGREYRLDLLFYHLRLRCFVVVELKVGPFEPEYAGKRTSTWRPWTTSSGGKATSRASASSSARSGTASWWSTRCEEPTSRSVWPRTGSPRLCRRRCVVRSRAPSSLSGN